MTTEMARHLIRDHKVDPGMLGRCAHRILDSVVLPGGRLYVKTRRFDWHPATRRERAMLPGAQMMLL